MLTRGIKFAC